MIVTIKCTCLSYLVYVDTMIKGPRCLKVVLHPLLQLVGYLMQREKVFEIPPFGLIERSSRVHSLYYRGHVTEHNRVHQSCVKKICCSSVQIVAKHMKFRCQRFYLFIIYLFNLPLTADQHRAYREYLLRCRVCRYVTESHGRQTAAREVQRRYVALGVCHVLHGNSQSIGQRMNPACSNTNMSPLTSDAKRLCITDDVVTAN